MASSMLLSFLFNKDSSCSFSSLVFCFLTVFFFEGVTLLAFLVLDFFVFLSFRGALSAASPLSESFSRR